MSESGKPVVEKTIPDEVRDSENVSIGEGLRAFRVNRRAPDETLDSKKVQMGEGFRHFRKAR